MVQVARDLRMDDHLAAERRRRHEAPTDQSADGTSTVDPGRSERPTGLRRLISFGLHA